MKKNFNTIASVSLIGILPISVLFFKKDIKDKKNLNDYNFPYFYRL